MTRRLCRIPVVLAVAIGGAWGASSFERALPEPPAGAVSESGVTSAAVPESAAMLPAGAAQLACLAERNTGPSGRLTPRSALIRCTRIEAVQPGLAARLQACAAARIDSLEYVIALALARGGHPAWRSTAPPPFRLS